MHKFLTSGMGFLVCLVFTGIVWSEELKIEAGAAPSENILKPVRAAFEQATGIKLSVVSSGPKVAMQNLEKGSVSAAAAGLSIQEWLDLMKKEGSEVKDPAALHSVTIGKDRIVVIIHKDNPVKKLSKEQLRGIFSGEIENWKGVGGNDGPILVVWGKLIQGTNSMFVNRIMDGKPLVKELIDATTAEDVRQNVTSNPTAIGIGPLAIINGAVNEVEIPEISRDITLVTKGKPATEIQKLIDFVKGEGQKYVKK